MELDNLIQAQSCIINEDFKLAKKFFDLYIDSLKISVLSNDVALLYEIEDDYLLVLSKLYKLDYEENNPAYNHYFRLFESINSKKYTSEELTTEEKFVSKMKVYEFDSIIGFGKYRGASLIDLINKNPKYVLWCIKSLNSFAIDNSCFLLPKLQRHWGFKKGALLINAAKLLTYTEFMGKDEELDFSDQYDEGPQYTEYDIFIDGFDGDMDAWGQYKDYS